MLRAPRWHGWQSWSSSSGRSGSGFLSALVAEARAAYGDPEIRREALAMAEEARPLDNEALDLAERPYSARAKAPHARSKGRRM